MGKQHISRLAAPNSWNVPKKTTKYITRPLPGAHPLKMGMPLNLVLRDNLHLASKAKEVKTILHKGDVLIDGKIRKEPKFIVGLMDVITIPKAKKSYRILLSKKGKLTPIEIDENEAKLKLAKITNKINVKGKKLQLNLSDGRNILVDKDDFKTGSSVVIQLPENKVKESIPLEKGSSILLTGGKHIGSIGVIDAIEGDKVVYKDGDNNYTTLKKYALVVGKGKPMIKMVE